MTRRVLIASSGNLAVLTALALVGMGIKVAQAAPEPVLRVVNENNRKRAQWKEEAQRRGRNR